MSITLYDENVKIDFRNLNIEEHAVKRAIERFNRKGKDDALNYFKTLLGDSKYLGESTCEHGKKAHMFVARNKTTIYVSLDCSKIITAYRVNEKSYIVYPEKTTSSTIQSGVKDENPLQEKLIKLYNSEFKKYDKMEKKLEKQFIELKLKLEIELLELKLLLLRARSEKNKSKYQNRITEVEKSISESEIRLKKVRGDKRKISKVLATLLTE